MIEAKSPLLLPHEHWAANKAFRNQEAPEGGRIWRMWQDSGPRGIALYMATCVDVLLGFPVGILGVLLVAASEGQGVNGHIGYTIGIVGMAIIFLGLIRSVQFILTVRRAQKSQK
jgi:hypothetical protein